jgi:hypothetical protein
LADKNFEVRKGITVANVVIVTSGSNTGFGNTNPLHTVSVNGPLFLSGNLVINTAISANGSVGANNTFLRSDGTKVHWSFIPDETVPQGSNTHIQFNDSGAFAGDANLVFNKVTATITTNNITLTTANVSVSVNSALFKVGTAFTANSTLVNATSISTTTNTVTFGTAAKVTANGNMALGANSTPQHKLRVEGNVSINGTLTGPNTSTNLDGFVINCGTW